MARQTNPAKPLLRDDTSEPMLVVDDDSLAFLEVNEAATTIYGYTREELLGMRLTDIVAPHDRGRLRELTRKDPKGSDFSDIRCLLKNGQSVEVDVLVHPIAYAGRKAVLVVSQDHTRRRQLEEQL